MVQSILSNLAIILLGHLLMSLLMNRRKQLSEKALGVCVVILFSGVIISMFYLPIDIDGYKFDMRLIPLFFLAIFRGWKVTVATLIIASIWRYFLGGVGTMPGIIYGMIGPTLLVLVYCALKKDEDKIFNHVLVLTGCWLISDFPIVFIVPNGWEVFKGFAVIRYSSIVIVAFIYYYFVKAEHNKLYYKTELERMAWHDQLTNLLNRRKFIELVEKQKDVCSQNQFIALIDIDHFKNINDTFGHLIGDFVLQELAKIFNKYKEENMIFARYGGEEFIVYFVAPSMDDAVAALERLRQIVKENTFETEDHIFFDLSISIGVAQLEKGGALKEAIHLADQRLYIAKEQGRDQLIAQT